MASSSSTINSQKFHVFLSFRGADTRNNITSHLYDGLCQAGVNVFIDEELNRGEEISSSLFQIIEGSIVSIVIFSPNYAASKFCLDELVKILECKTSKQQVVMPVFYGVDPSEVEKLTGKYGKYISRHAAQYKGFKRLFRSKKTIKEKLEKVKKWKSALEQAANLAGWDLRDRKESTSIRKIIDSVLKKLRSSPLDGDLVLNALASSKELFPEKRLVGVNFEDIRAWLTADDVSSIGIWGMGGVGKTALMVHIYNELMKKQEISHQVYWVTVPQDCNPYELQDFIAKEVGLDFGNEYVVLKRAARLLNALSSKGKFVLILDNLWKSYDAEKELGIPIKTKGCKLIITTRILDVCTQMSLQKIKKIEPLSEKDAWYLFSEELEHDLAVNVEKIARSIVRECDGLPLGIVTIAGSMRGAYDIREWSDALEELQRSELRPEDMGEKVFCILRFSYNRLPNPALRECILYCALFPEDHEINREELIELLFVEGIIDQGMSRQMNFNKGHVMLNKLVKVSLLEDVRREGVRYIKMHDLIRDMAIQITRACSPSILEAGRKLKHMPAGKYWKENIVRVSLMSNGINEIPSHYSPMCSRLSTLFLSHNCMLKSIPDSFFARFHGLTVLDLSFTGIEKLPESVGCLANLRALLLRVCRDLRSLPSLAKLLSLEILDLASCSALQEWPIGLELLLNLTFLNLHDSGLKKLRSKKLPWGSHLQFLAVDTHFGVKAKQLAGLENLESLYCRFHNFVGYRTYVQLVSLNQKQPINYFLSVGGQRIDKSFNYKDRPHSQEVDISNCKIGRQVFILHDMQILRMKGAIFPPGYALCLKIAATEGKSFETALKYLSISDCANIRYLFHLSSSPSILESLEALELNCLPDLLALFSIDEKAPSTSIQLLPNATTFSKLKKQLLPNDTTFSKLKRFIISRSDKMKSLCTPRVFSNFQNLEEIVVENCSEMEEIIGATDDKESCSYRQSNSTHDIVAEDISEEEDTTETEDEKINVQHSSNNFNDIVASDVEEMEATVNGESSENDIVASDFSDTEEKAARVKGKSYGYNTSNCFLADFSEPEIEESCGYVTSKSFHDLTENLHFNLPNLRSLTLKKLPKLERISSEQIVCASLKNFTVQDCESLKNIPISLPLPSLGKLHVGPENWWYSVQWGNPDQKDLLQPTF